MATEFVHIVGPSCAKVNRVAWTRLTAGPKCSACKEQRFTAHSVDLESKNFQQPITRNDIYTSMSHAYWLPAPGFRLALSQDNHQSTRLPAGTEAT